VCLVFFAINIISISEKKSHATCYGCEVNFEFDLLLDSKKELPVENG